MRFPSLIEATKGMKRIDDDRDFTYESTASTT
jgi:hypothetical protein